MLLLRSGVVMLLLASTLASPQVRRRRIRKPQITAELGESSAIDNPDGDASQADSTDQAERPVRRRRKEKEEEEDDDNDEVKMTARGNWRDEAPSDYVDYDEEAHESENDVEEIASRSGITPNSQCAREVANARIEERMRLKHMARLRANMRMQGPMMFGQGYGPQNPPNMSMPPKFAGPWAQPANMMPPPPPFYESDPFMPGIGARMDEQKSLPYVPEPIEPEYRVF